MIRTRLQAHLLRHRANHSSIDAQKRHLQRTNSNKKHHYIFVCIKCGKRFSKSKALQNHQNEGECVNENVKLPFSNRFDDLSTF